MAKAAEHAEKASGMDYAEHLRTYENFLWLTKWTVAFVLAIMVGMLAGFFGGMGLAGGILVFVVLMIVSFFLV